MSRRRWTTPVRVPASAAMADAEPEAEDGSEDGGGGGGRALPDQRGSATRVAPLGPEQLRRVLEQVTKAQPPPPPFVLQDAARRLRDAAQQAALQRGPGAEPPRPPRLLPPQVRLREGLGETGRRGQGLAAGRRGPARHLVGLRAAGPQRPAFACIKLQRLTLSSIGTPPAPPVTAPAFLAPPARLTPRAFAHAGSSAWTPSCLVCLHGLLRAAQPLRPLSIHSALTGH